MDTMMNDSRKPIYWMVLFGVVRHLLGLAGAWLLTRGLIDADTHQRMISEGASDVVGWLLVLAPVAWSVLQKFQVWRFIVTALHLSPRTSTASEVPAQAKGPNIPI